MIPLDLDAMEAAAQRLLTAHGLTADGTGDNDRIISPAITSARDVLALAAALRTERAAREAAEAQHAALAGAGRAEREALTAVQTADDAQSRVATFEPEYQRVLDDALRASATHDAARKHLDALLRGAPGGYVEARVVREYLAALDRWRAEETRWEREYLQSHTAQAAVIAAAREAALAARTALDAALLAATTTPKESL